MSIASTQLSGGDTFNGLVALNGQVPKALLLLHACKGGRASARDFGFGFGPGVIMCKARERQLITACQRLPLLTPCLVMVPHHATAELPHHCKARLLHLPLGDISPCAQ